MGISFEESLRNEHEKQVMSFMPMVLNEVDDSVVAEEWALVENEKYEIYEEYSDNNLSTVDEDKNIILNNKQINLTQETNSQYIPFQMPRYFDGYDLTRATIQVYFVNRDGNYGINYPVNVYCSSEKIKFGWLVDYSATALSGKLKFEIQAIGKNSKAYDYVWKTRPNSEMNILESLNGKGYIEPDESWQDNFLMKIDEKVALVQRTVEQANSEINDIVADAQVSIQNATTVAETSIQREIERASGIVDSLSTDVDDALQTINDSVGLANNAATEAEGHAQTAKFYSDNLSQQTVEELKEEVQTEVQRIIDEQFDAVITDVVEEKVVEVISFATPNEVKDYLGI